MFLKGCSHLKPSQILITLGLNLFEKSPDYRLIPGMDKTVRYSKKEDTNCKSQIPNFKGKAK